MVTEKEREGKRAEDPLLVASVRLPRLSDEFGRCTPKANPTAGLAQRGRRVICGLTCAENDLPLTHPFIAHPPVRECVSRLDLASINEEACQWLRHGVLRD